MAAVDVGEHSRILERSPGDSLSWILPALLPTTTLGTKVVAGLGSPPTRPTRIIAFKDGSVWVICTEVDLGFVTRPVFRKT